MTKLHNIMRCSTAVIMWLCLQSFSVFSVGQSIAQPVPQGQPAEGVAAQGGLGAPVLQEGENAYGAIDEVTGNPVFGANLFAGGFSNVSFQGFNPNYRLNIGDIISLQLWGGYEVNTQLALDAQGNVFIPNIGPVKLQGVANKDLNTVLAKKVASVYQRNVKLYASLDATQPVKLFVTGFVERPGLYGGLSSDSVLAYLEKAGGISSESGSYIDIQLKRNNKTLETFNLYSFLISGDFPQRQLRDGDVIVVGPKKTTVMFAGLVENPVQLEFSSAVSTLKEGLAIVGVDPEATHVRVTRGNRDSKEVEYYSLREIDDVEIHNGDQVDVVGDKPQGSIIIFIEGEHKGRAEYVLPYGSTMEDILALIEPSQHSSMDDIQLFREEVAKRQKEMLLVSLQRLENATFSARSSSTGEAALRASDAQMIGQFIERAKDVEPLGQVVLSNGAHQNSIVLKDKDRLMIPAKSLLVQVHGEVMFPSAMVWNEEHHVEDYVLAAGGFSQKKKQSKVLIVRRNGSLEIVAMGDIDDSDAVVNPGDEIMVIAQVDSKSMQYAMDISQVIYQIALAARVAVLF